MSAYSANITSCVEPARSSNRSGPTPTAAKASVIRFTALGSSSSFHLSSRREPGAASSTRAHNRTTSGVILPMLLKLPKTTDPFGRADGGPTSGV